jgi:arabinofuranosyltransferase
MPLAASEAHRRRMWSGIADICIYSLPRMHQVLTPTNISPPWRRYLAAGSVVLAAGIAVVTVVSNKAFYHDDAFITLRYAQNWLAGNGIVWNPGEYVQGYTNFLQLVGIAALAALGMDIAAASQAIGFAAALLLPVITAILIVKFSREEERKYWHLPVCIALASTPILVWALGGLEGPLLAFLIGIGCLLLIQPEAPGRQWPYVGAGICLGLAILTRPDSALVAFIALCWLVWDAPAHCSRIHRLLLVAVPIALLTIPYAVWVRVYYGDFLPNTYYAKTGIPASPALRNGLIYLSGYLLEPPFLGVILVGLTAATLSMRRWDRRMTLLASIVVLYMLYVVYVGGDHMKSYRFMLPVIPVMGLLFWLLSATVLRRIAPRWEATVCALLLGAMALQLTSTKQNPRAVDRAVEYGTVIGRYINNYWPPNSLAALHTAGSTPFYAQRMRFIDMLGLNDAHIAKRRIDSLIFPWQAVPGHAKGDGAYVLSRRPDYIILGPANGANAGDFCFLSDAEIFRDPRFLREYIRDVVLLDSLGRPDTPASMMFTFYRRVKTARDSQLLARQRAMPKEPQRLYYPDPDELFSDPELRRKFEQR